MPFDGVCVLTMDPVTRLATSAFVEHGLREEAATRMAEIEYRERDINKFGALARSGRIAASLHEATDGKLGMSVRHRELRAPNGLGDELRAVLIDNSDVTWGGITLGRGSDCKPFTPADVALMASVSQYLAEGLRRAALLTSLSATGEGQDASAGLALLASDNSIVRSDPVAETLLAELAASGPDSTLPPVVIAVASRARSIATGSDPSGVLARARVRTPSGSWLTVRASILGHEDGPLTAVTLEPARPHDLAPLIADASQLTNREREITRLVAQGLTTDAIARRVYISPWTVQDHLKSIFEKVGVRTRGELVARLFFDPYTPRLSERAVGTDSWFSTPHAA